MPIEIKHRFAEEKKKYPARYIRDVEDFKKKRTYCGWCALSAITGANVEFVKDLIRDIQYGSNWRTNINWKNKANGKKTKKCPKTPGGVNWMVMVYILSQFGCLVNVLSRKKSNSKHLPTVEQWAAGRTRNQLEKIHLITVGKNGGHWIVIDGDMTCDTFTYGKVVPLSESKHLRKRVRQVIEITPFPRDVVGRVSVE